MTWKTKKLAELCKMYQPKTLTKKQLKPQGKYLVYGANGIIGKYDKYNHEESQLIITCRGATCGSINISEPFSWINGNAMVIQPNESEISKKFIEYLFKGPINLSKIITGSAQPQITRESLNPILVSYPSLTEQQHIVTKLDAAFAEIDKTILNVEKKLTNTINLANTILSKFFEKNDNDWKDVVLNDVCKNITDGKHGDCKPQENSGYYFLSAKDVKNNILNYEKARQITKDDFLETHRRTNLEPGDLLITNSGTIGRMAIVDDNLKTYKTTFQKSVAILKPIHDAVNNKFLFYLLKSKLKYFANISQGTAQKNLLLRDIREMKIKLPVSLAEQSTISSKCENLLSYIKEMEISYKKKHKNLIQLKKSILIQELNSEFKQAS